MDRGARRDIAQRQRVSYQNVSLRPAHDLLPQVQPQRVEDVALLAISIGQQGQTRGPVGIVFDGHHGCRHTQLLALEVHQTQLAFMPAATAPDGDITFVPPPVGPLLGLGQRLVRTRGRQLVVRQSRLKPQRRRDRSISLDCHKFSL
jgi:hypothetical protein